MSTEPPTSENLQAPEPASNLLTGPDVSAQASGARHAPQKWVLAVAVVEAEAGKEKERTSSTSFRSLSKNCTMDLFGN